MPDLTHTYPPAPAAIAGQQALLVVEPLDLDDQPIATRTGTIPAAGGTVTVDIPATEAGVVRVRHVGAGTTGRAPAGWDGTRFTVLTTSALMTGLTPYRTPDGARATIPGPAGPVDRNMVLWGLPWPAISWDPALASQIITLDDGRVHIVGVTSTSSATETVTGVTIPTNGGGSGWTTGASYVGLYSLAGTLLAQSAPGALDTAFTGGSFPSYRTVALTSSYSMASGANVYVAVLMRATARPGVYANSSLTGTLASPYTRRVGLVSGTLSALPASIDPSALVASGRPIILALSTA